MRYITIAKDKDMFYSNRVVREHDPKLFNELDPHLGRCENDNFIMIEDTNYINLLIKEDS